MADFKGGRGKKTGYQTEMYRIPSPIRPIIEKLGMQFRILWDGVSDPKGEKLISRIEAAIPDCEQPSTDKLISSKAMLAISDIKYEESGDENELEEEDGADPTDEQTIRDQAAEMQKYIVEIRMMEKEALANRGELAELREQLMDKELEADKLSRCLGSCEGLRLENQRLLANAAKADSAIGELRSQLKEQKLEIERLRQLEQDGAEQLALEVSNSFKAADILKAALLLKANAGGEIKKRIREALQLIDDI